MPENRCPWSELPTNQCDHCTDDHTPTNIRRPKPNRRPMRIVYPIAHQEPTPQPTHARHLPDDTKHWQTPDYITALCDPTTSREPYTILEPDPEGGLTTRTTRHRTTNPPLLEQLWSAAETSRGMDSGNRTFGSRPSASLEALDVALWIETAVHQLLTAHGVVDSHDTYPDTVDAVRHLGSLTTDERSDDARTIRRWWASARVITGWDLPAWRPDNTCPLCGMRGSLRVKYPTGLCVNCAEVWDESTIGLLVEHVRAENHEDDEDTPDVNDRAG